MRTLRKGRETFWVGEQTSSQLNALVEQEKDISYKALLQKIIADRDNIRDLQEKVAHLEQTLPDKFVVAKRGDRHQDLAMAYLTGEANLDAARAKILLNQVDQTDELLAGNSLASLEELAVILEDI